MQQVQASGPGDVLFIHYSGHGTQVPVTDDDPNEEEDDGMDEAICPCDMVCQGESVDCSVDYPMNESINPASYNLRPKSASHAIGDANALVCSLDRSLFGPWVAEVGRNSPYIPSEML